jgi:hypothetical protein
MVMSEMRSGRAAMRPTPCPRCPGGVLVRDLTASHDIYVCESCATKGRS